MNDPKNVFGKYNGNVELYLSKVLSTESLSTQETINYPSLEKLENLETESLFKLKLEIFEQEIVQNSENREIRTYIRKSKNVIELMHYYWEIQQEKVNETE